MVVFSAGVERISLKGREIAPTKPMVVGRCFSSQGKRAAEESRSRCCVQTPSADGARTMFSPPANGWFELAQTLQVRVEHRCMVVLITSPPPPAGVLPGFTPARTPYAISQFFYTCHQGQYVLLLFLLVEASTIPLNAMAFLEDLGRRRTLEHR